MARRRKPAGIAVPPAFLAEMGAQDMARRLMQYAVIGRLARLQTEQGAIEFPRETGPGVGVEATREQFLFITPWPALPELQQYSEEFCQACLQTCEICGGAGAAPCIFVGCGGAGKRTIGIDGCPKCVAAGALNPLCEFCHGSGNVPIYAECPCCKGSGRAMCGPCRGGGKRPTGLIEICATCTACRGTLRGGEWRKQDLHSLIAGVIGKYVVVGPVTRLTVKLPSSGRGQAPVRNMEFSAGERQMVLLPVDMGTNPPAYFWRQRGS